MSQVSDRSFLHALAVLAGRSRDTASSLLGCGILSFAPGVKQLKIALANRYDKHTSHTIGVLKQAESGPVRLATARNSKSETYIRVSYIQNTTKVASTRSESLFNEVFFFQIHEHPGIFRTSGHRGQ